jgi:hypothetical protein
MTKQTEKIVHESRNIRDTETNKLFHAPHISKYDHLVLPHGSDEAGLTKLPESSLQSSLSDQHPRGRARASSSRQSQEKPGTTEANTEDSNYQILPYRFYA